MKRIDTYISEKLHINNTTKIEYMYHPKTKDELVNIIQKKIEKEGLGTEDEPLDLNDIDTSKITDMCELFDVVDGNLKDLSENGNFDISNWNVSNVKDMSYMFYESNFDGDISNWDVSSVENMQMMFNGSKFTGENGDLSKWNVNKVENMYGMFYKSAFTGENGNLSDWDVNNVRDMDYMFYECPLQNNPPKWYKNTL